MVGWYGAIKIMKETEEIMTGSLLRTLFRNSRHSGLDLYVMYLWHNKRKDDLSIILQLLVVCSILDVFIVRNDNITAEDGDDK